LSKGARVDPKEKKTGANNSSFQLQKGVALNAVGKNRGILRHAMKKKRYSLFELIEKRRSSKAFQRKVQGGGENLNIGEKKKNKEKKQGLTQLTAQQGKAADRKGRVKKAPGERDIMRPTKTN